MELEKKESRRKESLSFIAKSIKKKDLLFKKLLSYRRKKGKVSLLFFCTRWLSFQKKRRDVYCCL
jgi:hypothetical protein